MNEVVELVDDIGLTDEADNELHSVGERDGVGADKFEEYDVTINQRKIELASVMGGRISSYKGAVKFTAKVAVGG